MRIAQNHAAEPVTRRSCKHADSIVVSPFALVFERIAPIKPTASKGPAFAFSDFKCVVQLGISVYRQNAIVSCHDELTLRFEFVQLWNQSSIYSVGIQLILGLINHQRLPVPAPAGTHERCVGL